MSDTTEPGGDDPTERGAIASVSQVLRNTLLLSLGSIATVFTGIVSAKVFAILLGPTGVGYISLLENVVGLATLVAAMGIGVGLVREGAEAVAEGNFASMDVLRRSAWLSTSALSLAMFLVLVLLRDPIARIALGAQDRSDVVIVLGLTAVLALATGIYSATLNAYQRVGVLATSRAGAALAGTAVMLAFVWRWHHDGIVPGLLVGSGVTWAITAYLARREVGAVAWGRPTRSDLATSLTFVRFGFPYTMSMLAGYGSQLVLPILVLHASGAKSVGIYQAAAAISIGYLSFVLTAMSQDYFPRLSSASARVDLLVGLVNRQQRVVMLLGTPIILITLAIVPYLVPLIYSSQFQAATTILEWQLIGDVFKLISWTMSFVILIRSSSLTYFMTEAFAGISLVAASWAGMHLFGLQGIGIAFLVSYASYSVLVWSVVRRQIGLRLDSQNILLILAPAGATLLIRALPFLGLGELRTPVALVLAALACLVSGRMVWLDAGLRRMLRFR